MRKFFVAAAILTCWPSRRSLRPSPTAADKTNAAKECKAERGSSAATREAFRVKYGTNKNGKNAYGKCVSRRAKSEEAQREGAAKNAAKACKAERAADAAAFAAKYGTNKNGKNAYGKCVSQKAKALKKQGDRDDAAKIKARKSAAKECADGAQGHRPTTPSAQKYGTNSERAQRLRQVRVEGRQGLAAA